MQTLQENEVLPEEARFVLMPGEKVIWFGYRQKTVWDFFVILFALQGCILTGLGLYAVKEYDLSLGIEIAYYVVAFLSLGAAHRLYRLQGRCYYASTNYRNIVFEHLFDGEFMVTFFPKGEVVNASVNKKGCGNVCFYEVISGKHKYDMLSDTDGFTHTEDAENALEAALEPAEPVAYTENYATHAGAPAFTERQNKSVRALQEQVKQVLMVDEKLLCVVPHASSYAAISRTAPWLILGAYILFFTDNFFKSIFLISIPLFCIIVGFILLVVTTFVLMFKNFKTPAKSKYAVVTDQRLLVVSYIKSVSLKKSWYPDPLVIKGIRMRGDKGSFYLESETRGLTNPPNMRIKETVVQIPNIREVVRCINHIPPTEHESEAWQPLQACVPQSKGLSLTPAKKKSAPKKLKLKIPR